VCSNTDCPQEMIYKQCGYYTTCSFLNANRSSSLECESGCFCEDGKVHYNGSCSEIDICGMNNFMCMCNRLCVTFTTHICVLHM